MPRIYWSDDVSTVPAGRAASYTAQGHIVTASSAFKFYRDLLAWAEEEARDRASADMDEAALRAICEDEVKRWFEQALVEAVVNLRPMAHNKHWGPKVYETGLSDEGLTAAVMSHRWHMLTAIKRGLAGRLGKSRPA